jgi:uncharacterized membrane protein (UPF0127 family)
MNRRHLLLLVSAVLAQGAFMASGFAQLGAPIKAAQPTLPTEKLVIITKDGVRHEFNVEMAKTPREQEIGLMFRPTVAPDGGMLFDWGVPQESQMWMKNTIASLDMVFINQDGTIRSIIENAVPQSLAVLDSHGPVRATLELAAGTTARLGILVGDRVEAPSLSSKAG